MPRANALLLAVLLSGCGLRLQPPPLEKRLGQTPEESWALLLTKRLDPDGRVDFEGIKKEPAKLHNFISYIATFSPESDPARFPSAASRLAYYVNAYNALALYAVVDSEAEPADRRRFYSRVKMMVGGSLRTLSDLEEALEDLKDARVWFAINGAARGFPRLAAAPYGSITIEDQLNEAAASFLNDPRHVQVDKAKRRVRLSEVLKRRRGVFTDRAASLLAYVNKFRREKVPEGYAVEFLPFDWSLNEQRPEPQAKKPAR